MVGAVSFPSPYNSFPNTHSGVRIRGKAANDAGSTENCYNVTRIIVQRNKIHDPRGTAGSWDNGYPYGPQGIAFQEAGGNMVIRYNDIYGSDSKHFQDGIGGLDNFSKSGFPRENSDIYGNKISYCWDDGIEVEGADCNVRVYGNFLDNIFTGVASAVNSIGPLYVFRNITYVGRRHAIGASNSSLDIEDRGPFNKCGFHSPLASEGRTYLFHNTVLQPTQPGFNNPRGLDGGTMDNGGGPVQNILSRNNIWTAAYQGQGGRSIAENNSGSGVGCTYQYDVCNTVLVLNSGVASNIRSGNPSYAAGVPVAPLAINGGPRAQGYELATNSLGYDAGTLLPNFNDGFNGTAPDAGAYEAGKPLLEFGVNAYLAAPPANVPPVANAGSDITMILPVNSASLTGSGTDPDGTITGYSWTKVSGPTTFTLAIANSANTIVSNLVQGIYVFRLTVTDNNGATGTDDITVTVNAAINQPPTASAGSNIILTLPTNSTTLLGSGTDPDGTIVSYVWDRISGPTNYTFGSPNTATTTLTNLAQGIYVFRLTVTDNGGATGTANVTVTVNAASNQPPTANAGSNITLTLPTNSTTLVGSGYDPDGTIVSYAWSRVSGPTTYALGSPNSATTTLNNLAQGVYVFRLTVTDNAGATGAATVTVIVNAATNQPPTANAGNNITLTLPTNSTTLVGSGYDPDGTIVSYVWSRVSGPTTYTLGTPSAAATSLGNLVEGTYVIRLTVTDNAGATGTATVTVTVNAAANQPPVANAGNNIILTLPANSTTLSGSGTDPDGTITNYSWTHISGPTTFTVSNANAATTGLSNLIQGVYIFRLTVTDNNGATAFDEMTVTINASLPSNQAPVAIAGNNLTLNLPANTTILNGINSFDPDGTIVSYSWTKVNGPATLNLANANSVSTALTNLVQGTYVFRLTVTDNDGATNSDNVTVIVNAQPNQPPVANAGANIIMTLPQNSTILNGGSSVDPDGIIVSYAWSHISGPTTFTMPASNAAATILNNLVQGIYVFRLTVTDNGGTTATDDITVTVNAAAPPPNQTPVANAGADITMTLPLNSTILTGSGYDPDGTIVSFVWSRVSGPANFIIVNPSVAATGVNGLVQGTYVFKLTVTDNNGATATDNVTVTVNPSINQTPTANAGADIAITLPANTATLYGSGFDPDGTIASYAWSKVSGPATFTIANPGSAMTGLYNMVQGIYVFKLTVTDNRGAIASDHIMVTVNAAPPPAGNLPPVARTENDITMTLPVNSTLLHGNTSSDPDGVIVLYTWTQVSGPGLAVITNSNASIATASNLTTGIYTFQLKVIDDGGAIAVKTMKVIVENQRNPKAFFKIFPNPTSGALNLQYVSNANGKFRLTVYDASRRLVKDEEYDKIQVSITKTMDVSLFERGVYFIEIVSPDNERSVAQFVKM